METQRILWSTPIGEAEDMGERELEIVLQQAREVRMTGAQKEQQRRSFAYGNANIENSAVTKEIVDTVADELAAKTR